MCDTPSSHAYAMMRSTSLSLAYVMVFGTVLAFAKYVIVCDTPSSLAYVMWSTPWTLASNVLFKEMCFVNILILHIIVNLKFLTEYECVDTLVHTSQTVYSIK